MGKHGVAVAANVRRNLFFLSGHAREEGYEATADGNALPCYCIGLCTHIRGSNRGHRVSLPKRRNMYYYYRP